MNPTTRGELLSEIIRVAPEEMGAGYEFKTMVTFSGPGPTTGSIDFAQNDRWNGGGIIAMLDAIQSTHDWELRTAYDDEPDAKFTVSVGPHGDSWEWERTHHFGDTKTEAVAKAFIKIFSEAL